LIARPTIMPLPEDPEAAVARINEILRGYREDIGQRVEIERQRDEILRKVKAGKR
jgi:hypothetical protein